MRSCEYERLEKQSLYSYKKKAHEQCGLVIKCTRQIVKSATKNPRFHVFNIDLYMLNDLQVHRPATARQRMILRRCIPDSSVLMATPIKRPYFIASPSPSSQEGSMRRVPILEGSRVHCRHVGPTRQGRGAQSSSLHGLFQGSSHFQSLRTPKPVMSSFERKLPKMDHFCAG